MTKKDKMVYDDDNTIGVDEESLNQLESIKSRMQQQLVDEFHNNKFLNDHIQIIEG